MQFSAALWLAITTIFFAGAQALEARGSRLAQVPNAGRIGCALCHTDSEGGGRRNVFGDMVDDRFLRGGEVTWGPTLAALDADGDGATNGEELLDPAGTWKTGDPQPGDPERVSLPFDPNSLPQSRPAAVENATWAEVKALFSRPRQ